MQKKANDVEVGENIQIAGQGFKIVEKEISDIGKHGKRKVRLGLLNSKGEKMVIIRPDDYPFNIG